MVGNIKSSAGSIKNIRRIVVTCTLTLAVAAIFFVLAALTFTKLDVPKSFLQSFSTVLVVLAVALCSFVVAQKNKSNGLLTGLINGISVFAVLLFLTLFFGGNMTKDTVFKLVSFISSGAISGMLGVASGTKIIVH